MYADGHWMIGPSPPLVQGLGSSRQIVGTAARRLRRPPAAPQHAETFAEGEWVGRGRLARPRIPNTAARGADCHRFTGRQRYRTTPEAARRAGGWVTNPPPKHGHRTLRQEDHQQQACSRHESRYTKNAARPDTPRRYQPPLPQPHRIQQPHQIPLPPLLLAKRRQVYTERRLRPQVRVARPDALEQFDLAPIDVLAGLGTQRG